MQESALFLSKIIIFVLLNLHISKKVVSLQKILRESKNAPIIEMV